MEPIKKIIKVRKYKVGYEVRTELISGEMYGGGDFEIVSAYTDTGDYIGDSIRAYRLYKKGIRPMKIDSTYKVCSIGFCDKELKWYGYSHRAIYGFGVGSKVEKGDCGYKPSNRDEFLEGLEMWYSDEMYKNLKLSSEPLGVRVYHEIHQKGTGKIFTFNELEAYPDVWGRGEWVAKNLDDAREMAIDFARGVS